MTGDRRRSVNPPRPILVPSYWNLNAPAAGGTRRVAALLEAIGRDRVFLVQPAPAHPVYAGVTYGPDFGRWRRPINFGLFNFFWPSTARRLRRLVGNLRPAAVVLTSMWTWAPFRRAPPGVPVIWDAHDVNDVIMSARFGAGHPISRVLRAWERRVLRVADRVIACSDVDRDLFIRMYGTPAERLAVVPNGVHVPPAAEMESRPPLPPALESALGSAVALLFMGNAAYRPNAEGLAFLVRTVLPALEARQPGRFRLLVCGGALPARLSHPAVVAAGKVPDEVLTACLRRAEVCLSPTFSGSGTRLKVLEYLAWARPVVATAKGVEGIAGTPGRDYVVAEPPDFATRILDLAADPGRAKALGAAGRRLVEARYDWPTCLQPRWRQIIDECIAGPDRG